MSVLPDFRHPQRMSSPKLARGRHSQVQAMYVVTVACFRRQPLFSAPMLARLATDQLSQSDREGVTRTHAWVLMPDHLHWLFTLQGNDLADVMRRFKWRSARAINAEGDTSGPVWQAGYYDHRVRDQQDLSVQVNYLIANPVRKGLVDSPHRYPHWGCRWIPNEYPTPPDVERSLLRSTHDDASSGR